eukprot:TRINITY_DN11177_c0_g1_i3.p1 TRINITY_DN11177_c0_g1~~TRINITY_DN11177_c0_g1_i3.p1  ORF type:complete len:161 (+),score=26.69 TRINITY_DN11177_c0_g1_i3:594-1076(+)
MKGLCLYAHNGSHAVLEFLLDVSGNILTWQFRNFDQKPPSFPSFDDLVVSNSTHQYNNLPSFYLSCEFSGRRFVLSEGVYDYSWFYFWGLSFDAPLTQNGIESVSSVDARGCWEVVLWKEPGWKGENLTFSNDSARCFSGPLGWMNDKMKSISVAKTRNC